MGPTAEQTLGRETSGGRPISLVIPCKPEYVGLCRLVAGVIGARESLEEDEIADIKLVVTEACTCFVWRSEDDSSAVDASVASHDRAPGSLRVDFYVTPDSWEITVSDPDHRRRIADACRCDPMSEAGLGLTIIKALVDKVEQSESEDEGSVLRLVKRLRTSTAPSV